MNKVYQRIWSKVKERWILVDEKVAGKGGPSGMIGAITLAAFLSLSGPATALEPGALPTEGKITSGKGSISTTGRQMTVNQSTQKMIATWDTFNIGTSAGVTFKQPSSKAAVLNRIYDQNPSQILGSLSANGQVFLLNPSGIIFGWQSQINVGGLVASSLDMLDSDFLAGKYRFSSNGNAGSIINQSNLSVIPGGVVALIAPQVTNEGTITATGGNVIMAAGNQVSLDFNGDGLISYTINKGAIDALAANKGLIQADGGLVVMTAEAADSLTSAVVNNSAVIRARTLQNKNGRIMLMSDMEDGQTIVYGNLDASAPYGGNGGFIETSAKDVKVVDGTIVTTAAPRGITGTWVIDPYDFNVGGVSSDMSGAVLSASLGTSNVGISSDNDPVGTEEGNININEAVSWSANTILGLSAYNDINFNANITATGSTAGLVITPDTGGVGGNYYFNNGAVVTLTGLTPSLTIAGNVYTVINEANGGVNALQNMNADLDGYYALGTNINATPTATWNAGAGFVPVGSYGAPFTGALEGLGHTIGNIVINRPMESDIGLFGYTSGSTIRNVRLSGGSVIGEDNVGGLVGFSDYSTIDNVFSSIKVSGDDDVGGLVGDSYGGSILNSRTSGLVQGRYSVGGLVGENDNGIIDNSSAIGAVKGNYGVGGLIGSGYGITVTNSYATGVVSGEDSAGGLAGRISNGSISNSHATGAVIGTGTTGYGYGYGYGNSHNIGGLVGSNYGGSITDSYATGDVQGNYRVGGLVGQNRGGEDGGIITGSYATGAVSGYRYVGGLVGTNYGGSIYGSHATGAVFGKIRTSGYGYGSGEDIGGLVGRNATSWYGNGGTIENSYATGIVSGEGNVGGLVGRNDGSITDSHATGTVTGSSNIGGLVGSNYGGSIYGSYATGAVVGNNNYGGDIGGLVGENRWNSFWDGSSWIRRGGTIEGSHATGMVIGLSHVGGLVGSNGEDSSITNSYATGAVRGSINDIGGLVGINYGSIYGSHATGAVSADIYGYYVGGLVGRNHGGSIDHAYATGDVNGKSTVGGLAGYNYNGSINNSYATGAVSGNNYTGGLVGYNYNGSINNSYATGAVSGEDSIGGLIGSNSRGSINNVYATGNATGEDYVGGLVGYNYSGTISNAFAGGTVRGYDNVGGLVGSNYGGISYSHAIGAVYGYNDVGGFVGYNYGTITDSASSGTVSGSSYVGGFVGYNNGNITRGFWDTESSGTLTGIGGGFFDPDAVGQTTAQMMTQAATYTGWDFTTFWWMADGYTRPFLRLEYSTNITNAHQLQLMALDPTADYTLAADLDMTDALSNSSEMWGTTGFNPVGDGATPFTGTFDGQNHIISNFFIDHPSQDYVGLFGYTGEGSSVSNVGLSSGKYGYGSVTGRNFVGGLVGYNSGGSIGNSYATLSVSGEDGVGGLVGYNSGSITDSYTTMSNIISSHIGGDVDGTNNVGGLVGYNSGSITNSYATLSVSGESCVGGLVGYNSGSITNSYATGMVSSGKYGNPPGNGIGGLVGANIYGSITNSHATGTVNGGENGVGGLVGYGFNGSITNSYATGAVITDIDNPMNDGIGGLVGINMYGSITNSWASGAVSGNEAVGGLVGGNSGTIDNAFASGTVNGYNFIGGLVGSNYSGNITNSYATGNVTGTGTGIGGLVGDNYGGTIANTFATGDVSGDDYTGGLVGFNTYGSIENSYAIGDVSGDNAVGGLVGENHGGSIDKSYAIGDVTGTGFQIGGLVGYHWDDGSITNSYAAIGAVSGSSEVGGLVGSNSRSSIDNSYSSGTVNGFAFSGGLVGFNYQGTISDSYATSAVSGDSFVGGLVGRNDGSIENAFATGLVSGYGSFVCIGGLVGDNYGTVNNSFWDTTTSGILTPGIGGGTDAGATGLDTAGMQTAANFNGAGWDNVNTWNIADGSYPTLKVFSPAVNVWEGDVDSLWTTADNWNLGYVPTIFQTAQIDGSSIDIPGIVMVKDVTNTEGATLNFTGATVSSLAIGQDSMVTLGSLADPITIDYGDSGKLNLTGSGSPLILDLNGTTYIVIQRLGSDGSLSAADLQGMNGGLSGRYVLGLDIDASSAASWNSATGFTPIGSSGTPFTGVVDGLGHSVNNLYINRSSTDNQGLFGSTNGATISNIGVVNANITGDGNVGGLVGYNYGGSFDNTWSTGSMSGKYGVGGLVGYNYGGVISNSRARASTFGIVGVGGLVGVNEDGSISDSHADTTTFGAMGAGGLVGFNKYGDITHSYANSTMSGAEGTGGLVGMNIAGNITDSYTTGSVIGKYGVGGLVGINAATPSGLGGAITGSHSMSSVTGVGEDGEGKGEDNGGSTAAGGLVGINLGGSISDSWAGGSVTGRGGNGYGYGYGGDAVVGGLVGQNKYGSITDSYATGAVTGTGGSGHGYGYGNGGNAYVGGLVGQNVEGSISGSHATGSVTGTGGKGYGYGSYGGYGTGGSVFAGGLVGANGFYNTDDSTLEEGGSITNSYATGNVTATGGRGYGDSYGGWYGYGSSGTGGTVYAGGLVGQNFTGDITNSYATGNVTGTGGDGNSYGNGWYGAAYGYGGSVYAGGLIGRNFDGNISDSHATGKVTATGGKGFSYGYGWYGVHGVGGDVFAGGLVGQNFTGDITGSYATGNVTGTGGNGYSHAYGWYGGSSTGGNVYAGGLVGHNYGGGITEAYATGAVTATGGEARALGYGYGSATGGSTYAGGLVGYNWGGSGINLSYATGSVTGMSGTGNVDSNGGYGYNGDVYAGGLVGANFVLADHGSTDITGSYATGAVTGIGGASDGWWWWTNSGYGTVGGDVYAGGLVGYNDVESYASGGNITDAYATGQVAGLAGNSKEYGWNGDAYAGGLVGANMIYAYGTGGNIDGSSAAGDVLGIAGSNSWYGGDGAWGGKAYVGGLVGMNKIGISGINASGGNITDSSSSSSAFGMAGDTRSYQGYGGDTFVGGMVGLNFVNAYSTGGNIYGSSAAGMVFGFGGRGGYGDGGHVYAGGLVGANTVSAYGTGANITDSHATGAVTGQAGEGENWSWGGEGGSAFVGGLVGVNEVGSYGTGANIHQSYATGAVTGTGGRGSGYGDTYGGHAYVGGLVGYNRLYIYGTGANITESFATGDVYGEGGDGRGHGYGHDAYGGNAYVGGLVGLNDLGGIADAYATGNVTGMGGYGRNRGDAYGGNAWSYGYGGYVSDMGDASVGGLVGHNDGTVLNSFWDTETSGTLIGIGGGTDAGATGLTTAEMMTLSTFTDAGWSIDDAGGTGLTWRIYDGRTYPLLRHFLTPLSVSTIDGGNDSKMYDGVPYYLGDDAVYDPAAAQTDPNIFCVLTYGDSTEAVHVGTYDLALGGLFSNQMGYDIDFGSGTLTINPAPINLDGVRLYDGTTVFDAALFGTNGTISTGVGTETLMLTGSGSVASPNVSAGIQALNMGTLTLNNGTGLLSDYMVVSQTGMINPAPISFTGTRMEDGTVVFDASLFGTNGTISTGVGTETIILTGYGSVGSSSFWAGLQNLTGGGTTLFMNDGTGLAGNYTFVGGVQTGKITPDWMQLLTETGAIVGAGTLGGYYLANLLPPPDQAPPQMDAPQQGDTQPPSFQFASYLAPPPVVEGISVEILKLWQEPAGSTPGSPGIIMVGLPDSLSQPGAFFTFELPKKIASEIAENKYAVTVTLADGKPLPAWLRYNPATKTFTAMNVPEGYLPVEILINFGGQSWKLEIYKQ